MAPNKMVRELEGLSDLIVKQSRRGWFQECLGCEAKTLFRVSTLAEPSAVRFTLLEESSCCLRVCCPAMRPWTTTLAHGAEEGGEALVLYERPFKCAPGPAKCCCYQQVLARDARSGQLLGSVVEAFYCCVPKLHVLDAAGTRTHFIRQPTCCFGTCVNVCDTHGGGCCKVPFYVYALADADSEPDGKIVKVWGGLARELMTDADTFQLSAPKGAPTEQIATLLGATVLINELYFESYAMGEGKEAASPSSML